MLQQGLIQSSDDITKVIFLSLCFSVLLPSEMALDSADLQDTPSQLQDWGREGTSLCQFLQQSLRVHSNFVCLAWLEPHAHLWLARLGAFVLHWSLELDSRKGHGLWGRNAWCPEEDQGIVTGETEMQGKEMSIMIGWHSKLSKSIFLWFLVGLKAT